MSYKSTLCHVQKGEKKKERETVRGKEREKTTTHPSIFWPSISTQPVRCDGETIRVARASERISLHNSV